MNLKKDFLYYMVDDQGRSMYVLPNGNVARTPVPTSLVSTPDGWKEISISLGRSTENPGIYRSYTIPIKAVRDGGKIVKYLYATEGVHGSYYLVILKLNRATDVYEQYFISKIDFKEFLGDPYGATITVLEGGLVELIKNRGNAPFEIPLDVPEAITLHHDGIVLQGRNSFIVFNGTNPNLLRNHTAALNLVENDTGAAFGAKSAQRVVIADFTGPTVEATGSNFLEANISGDITLNITDLQLHVSWVGGTGVNPTPGISFFLSIRVQEDDTVLSTTNLATATGVNNVYGPNISLGKTFTVNGSFTVNVPANGKVYLIAGVNVVGATGDALTRFDYLTAAQNLIAIEFTSRYPPTKMKVLRPEYVFDQLIKKLSDGKYSGSSVPLATKFKNTVLTSGAGVRGLEGAAIKTTLNDFVKSYYAQHAVSISATADSATMEELPFFFSGTNIVDLTVFGDVANLNWEPFLEYIHSGVDVGTPDQQYDDLNGRDEPNTLFRFLTATTVQENVLDLSSVYRKDAYGIEFERINLSGKKTTDSISDNNTFMIDIADVSVVTNVSFSNLVGNVITLIDRFQSVFAGTTITVSGSTVNDGTYTVVSVLQTGSLTEITVNEAVVNGADVGVTITSNEAALNRPAFTSITGLIAPDSIFNVMLSPKRALLAHGAYIHSGLDFLDNTYITFQRADKNDKMATVGADGTIVEKENVFVGSLPAPLFRPIIFTFETRVPINLMDILDLSPAQKYGRVKFQWKGVAYYGFIMAAGQVPDLNPKQTWKLLCAPGVNILPLING